MDETTKLWPIDGLSIIIVDEDKHHANSTRSMLCQRNFHATAYTSPIEALDFLKGHAQEVDVALVAIHMEEIHGYQFLDIVREDHKNIQVIMMSKETTLDKMRRCVELGARFLVNKPIDANTIRNMWQHLDINPRMENIKHLLQGYKETQCASHQKQSAKTNKGYISWTQDLHGKFLRALEILGEDACPRNIEIIMNMEGVNRKHIASHMQKYRQHMEAEKENDALLDENKRKEGSSTSKYEKSCHKGRNISLISPDIQQAEITIDEDILIYQQIGSLCENNAYTAMQRSIQLGMMYDESQYVDVSPSDEESIDGTDIIGDESSQDAVTSKSGFREQVRVGEALSTDRNEEIFNNSISRKQDCIGDKSDKPIKLVDYSDSEDDEIQEYGWL